MRIRLIEHGQEDDAGAFYEFQADLDVANADEAYVKGREFQQLTSALNRGAVDQWKDERALRSQEIAEAEPEEDEE